MIDVQFNKAELDKIARLMDNASPLRRPQAYKSAMRKACETMRNALVKNVSGRIVKVRTGHLRRSMQYDVRIEGNEFVGRVGSNVGRGEPVVYDAYLEDGTKRIRAREHKAITVKETEGKVKSDFIRFLEGQLKRG